MAHSRSRRLMVRRHDGGSARRAPDDVAVEEPLEIRVDGQVATTTMRTPGNDHDLAVGFAWAEGLLDGARLDGVRSCGLGLDERAAFNVVDVATGGTARPVVPRLTPTTAACGVCGSATVDEMLDRLRPLDGVPSIPVTVLVAMAEAVRPHQELFARTGGVHAAAAFRPDGEVVLVREDIGRHNAVDKVVGRLRLTEALPASDLGLYVSGRAGFEIVQKAWAAGFGTVVAVGAPTSLAVEVARTARITLAAFLRPGGLNVYSPD
ncbi:sulfurtransferase FdhD [Iamia sp. SCSIO 61187]|uniref:formate dehydrogenase accessory sulfurtransferase FdhD n=1 Tax=Iamia sp. SCSIO 61187 TaxID=2722752 RepID=UPI001C63AA14|nr:formate dehydrogenase accessory sulfurtransferase FdhD [Iamia sp. SCSIO 61187]QYG91644.1 sulfurtransferase FdhD [Iamia sp. SCSIO 61187]